MNFNKKLRDNITKNFELCNCDHEHNRILNEIEWETKDITKHKYHPFTTTYGSLPYQFFGSVRSHLSFTSINNINNNYNFIMRLRVIMGKLYWKDNNHLFGKKYSEIFNK